MAKVKTEIEQTGKGQQSELESLIDPTQIVGTFTGKAVKSEWVHPEAEAIFNALLGAYEHAKEAGFRAQFWRSMMLSLGEFYIADKPRVVEFFLNQEGINQPVQREIPAKPAKVYTEKIEPNFSKSSGRESSAGQCESCG